MKTLSLEQLGTVTGGATPTTVTGGVTPTIVTRGRVVQVDGMRARLPAVEVERINHGINFYNRLFAPK